MSTAHDPMKAPISLHGLGFIQVQLQGGQRLHVWHPDLPRRRCFEHSAIHNHRFGFRSQVLVGEMENIRYEAAIHPDGEYIAYRHEGARQDGGGRPWNAVERVALTEQRTERLPAGAAYHMGAYDFHCTRPAGDGRVATIMQKTGDHSRGATSLCKADIEPDTDFDRFQLSPAQLWTYVFEVLGAGTQVVGVLIDNTTNAASADDMAWLMRIDGIGRLRASLICAMGFTRCHDLQTQAGRDVLAERQRQITAENWTPEHDDEHDTGTLATAAGCYAMHTLAYGVGDPPPAWPWEKPWWKPSTDRRRNLVKAGALILAEIERIDRRQFDSPAGQNLPQQGGDQ